MLTCAFCPAVTRLPHTRHLFLLQRLPSYLHGEIRFAAAQREKLLSIITGALGSLTLKRSRASLG